MIQDYTKFVEAMQNCETFYFPNYKLPFLITSDACTTGIRGYLSQINSKNEEKILGWMSKKLPLTVRERNLTITESISVRELINYFRPITKGY